MNERGYSVTMTNLYNDDNCGYAYFFDRNKAESCEGVDAPTLPEAVADAALLALEAEK